MGKCKAEKKMEDIASGCLIVGGLSVAAIAVIGIMSSTINELKYGAIVASMVVAFGFYLLSND